MPSDNHIKDREYQITTKTYAIIVISSFLISLFVILTLWVWYLPNMEEAAEEERELFEEWGEEPISPVQDQYIPGIRFVYLISLISFGLLDGILVLLFSRRNVPRGLERKGLRMTNVYIFTRGVGLFFILNLSMVVLAFSTTGFYMNVLYLLIPILVGISVLFILYFYKKFPKKELEHEALFKIPEDVEF